MVNGRAGLVSPDPPSTALQVSRYARFGGLGLELITADSLHREGQRTQNGQRRGV